MKRVRFLLGFIVAVFGIASGLLAAGGQSPQARPAVVEPGDEGIPVTNAVVTRVCSPCHEVDAKGRMSRVSYRRTTPEGWQQTIKRMVRLDEAQLEPGEAREVLRYLADNLGLAPEEVKPGAFEVERRTPSYMDYSYTASKDTEKTCIGCHSMGRVILQRRTKDEWGLLVAMHRGMYPLGDQLLRSSPGLRPASTDDRPPDTRQPMDKAISHLASAFPLVTPEWSAWVAGMAPPRLQGQWALAGYQVGKGQVFGRVVISAKGGLDSAEFTTESTYTYARTGKVVTRSGRAIVYTGHQWRGSSGTLPPPGAPGWASRGGDEWREVLSVDRDWRHASGRWFTGGYTEIGLDVRLERIGASPLVMGVEPARLKAGASAQELRVYGANLPTRVVPADVNLGPGITVDRVVSATADQLVVAVSVALNATAGPRTVLVAAATGEASVAVYSSMDYIKVSPPGAMAYLGGGGSQYPKGYQQFEAVAYANGPDGKPNTKDDIELGLVDAAWTIEEYTTTYNDNDKDFVGTMDQTGFFTPNIDGPNPMRRFDAGPRGTNNWGDVWAVATFQPDGQAGSGGAPLKARGFLLVTCPTYMVFDQPEVGR